MVSNLRAAFGVRHCFLIPSHKGPQAVYRKPKPGSNGDDAGTLYVRFITCFPSNRARETEASLSNDQCVLMPWFVPKTAPGDGFGFWQVKFPDPAAKFPVPPKYFPVSPSREFASNALRRRRYLESLTARSYDFAKFPVGRENGQSRGAICIAAPANQSSLYRYLSDDSAQARQ